MGCIVLVLGVGRCAFRPPRVVFVLGLVSLINSLTSGKKGLQPWPWPTISTEVSCQLKMWICTRANGLGGVYMSFLSSRAVHPVSCLFRHDPFWQKPRPLHPTAPPNPRQPRPARNRPTRRAASPRSPTPRRTAGHTKIDPLRPSLPPPAPPPSPQAQSATSRE